MFYVGVALLNGSGWSLGVKNRWRGCRLGSDSAAGTPAKIDSVAATGLSHPDLGLLMAPDLGPCFGSGPTQLPLFSCFMLNDESKAIEMLSLVRDVI